MITVGTTVVSGSPINGGGGGVPLPSTDGYLSVTSGAYDAPSSASAIVNAGISSMVGYDPAGTAIVSDGAGGAQSTSADVSTLLGAADAAAALAAIGGSPRTYLAEPFTATDWTIVAPTSGNAGTSVASFESGGVGRITLDTTGAATGLTGPCIERALPTWDATARWRFRVRVVAQLNTSGFCNLDLYIRDSAGTSYRTFEVTASADPGDIYLIGNGGIVVTGPAAAIAWNSTVTLEIRYDGGALTYGFFSSAGIYTVVTAGAAGAIAFVPSHVGITGGVGVASAGYVEADSPVIEVVR